MNKLILVCVYCGIITIILSMAINAWSANTFTNGLTSENLTELNNRFCYQESATVINQTGNDGNCGLSYDGDYIISTVSDGGYRNMYFKYKKPLIALNTSIWTLKTNNTYYNLSIANCWNGDPNLLILRYRSNVTESDGYSYYSCYNGTEYISLLTIYSNNNTSPETLWYDGVDQNGIDGNWSTNVVWSGQWSAGISGFPKDLALYEEAMLWNVKNDIRYLSIPSGDLTIINAKLNLSVPPIYTNCTQETANISTSCGGLNTGNYNFSGSWDYGTVFALHDGLWNTGAMSMGGSANMTINYTKPSLANNAFIKVGFDYTRSNVTVPIPSSCFNFMSDKISVRLESSYPTPLEVRIYCLNSSGYSRVQTLSGLEVHVIWEEQIIWNMSNYPYNPFLKVGNITVWNYTGTFNKTNNQTSNFANAINNYLGTCVYSGGYCNVPFIFGSNASGILQYSALDFNNDEFIENSQTYNLTSYETKSETLSINISYDSYSYPLITGILYYNGTPYTGTKTGSGNNAVFSKSIAIPTGITNNSFYWSIGLTNSSGTFYHNSTTNYQNVLAINLTSCTSSPYINFTFKDEYTGGYINGTFDNAMFYYYLGSGIYNKSLTFSNTTEKSYYAFCFTPASFPVKVNATVQYASGGYPQRQYKAGLTLTNATTNVSLWLNLYGQYVTLQVTDKSLAPIKSATVSISRSGYGLIEEKITDDSGLVMVWLDPNYAYSITASKTGYVSTTQSITPTQTSYTLTLGGTTSYTIVEDYGKGISWDLRPYGYELNESTNYDFNFTINSSYWTLDLYGINVTDEDGNQIGYAIGNVGTGGTVSVTLNTSTNKTISVNAFYVVNGTYIYISSKIYDTLTEEGKSYSIWRFFEDLGKYLKGNSNDTDGLFGLKIKSDNSSFGLSFIIFLGIFLVVGIFTYRIGIDGAFQVLLIITGVVIFFEYYLNIIDFSPNSNLPFASIFIGLVTLIVGFWEVYR